MEFELSETLVETVVKPKRKYVRKSNGIDPLTRDQFEKAKEIIKKKMIMSSSMDGYRSHGNTNKLVEAYIDNIVNFLRQDYKIRSNVRSLHNEAHYVSYLINIFDYNLDTTRSYSHFNCSFRMEELHKNCSSIGIHHFEGTFSEEDRNYSNSQSLFKDETTFKLFLHEMEELASIFGYSNILYTISSESNKRFKDYVENTATKIDSFRNKRSQRIIDYYSKRI